MSITEIKTAIQDLTAEERSEVQTWLNGLSMDGWDREMLRDTELGGKLDRLAREAEAAFLRGECRPFP
jgi:hypothetical protein